MKQKNAYPLRIDEILQKKIKALAEQNDRSYRAQIENILKRFIQEYESENGPIDISAQSND